MWWPQHTSFEMWYKIWVKFLKCFKFVLTFLSEKRGFICSIVIIHVYEINYYEKFWHCENVRFSIIIVSYRRESYDDHSTLVLKCDKIWVKLLQCFKLVLTFFSEKRGLKYLVMIYYSYKIYFCSMKFPRTCFDCFVSIQSSTVSRNIEGTIRLY